MTTRSQGLLFGVPFYGMISFINFGKNRELVIRSDDRHIGSISYDTDLKTLLQRGLSLPLCHVILKVIVCL